MIDLHCHVLPGLDDGPSTVEEAVDLARDARADGIGTIAATPHVDWSHPSINSDRIRGAMFALQARLDAAGVDVRLVSGAELASGRARELDDAELRGLSLGGGGWLLLECPLMATLTPGFVETARSLVTRGHRVVLAHPERCPIFLRSPDKLSGLVGEGMVAQVTAGALNRRFGRTVRDVAVRLMESGAVHIVASDGHGGDRPARIGSELASAGIEPSLAAWYAHDVPSAIVAGREPPPRPAVGPRRRRERLQRLVGR